MSLILVLPYVAATRFFRQTRLFPANSIKTPFKAISTIASITKELLAYRQFPPQERGPIPGEVPELVKKKRRAFLPKKSVKFVVGVGWKYLRAIGAVPEVFRIPSIGEPAKDRTRPRTGKRETRGLKKSFFFALSFLSDVCTRQQRSGPRHFNLWAYGGFFFVPSSGQFLEQPVPIADSIFRKRMFPNEYFSLDCLVSN